MSKIREGYKQTKVGVIPEEWEVVRLGDVVDIKSGYAFKSKHFSDFTSKYQVIKMSNIYQNKLLLNRTPSFLNNVTSKELEFLLNKDDIVITLTGTMGKRDYGYSVQINNEKNLLLNQRLARLREINNKCNISFIGYQLKNDRFLFQFFESTRGGTGNQANVGIKDLSLFNISLPPLKEQQKIAQILSTWESTISKQEALIKSKEQLKKGLMQTLLSGEVRFKEFGAGTLVPSNKLGVEVSTSLNNHYNNGTKVPAPEWEEVRLGDVGKIIRGVSYKPNDLSPIDNNNTIRLMRSNNIKIGYLDTDEELQYVNKLKVKKSQKLLNGDLVICMANGSKNLVGKNGEYILEDTYSYTVGAFCAIFRFNGGIVNNFFRYLFQTNKYNYYVQNLLAGSNINNLKGNDIETMKFNVPTSFQEQQKIAQVLSTADKEITLLKEELEALKEQKRGLMQRLLSGDVRVVV